MKYCIIGTGPTNNFHADTCQLVTRNEITLEGCTNLEGAMAVVLRPRLGEAPEPATEHGFNAEYV
jgi:hypothetical protein